MTDEAQLNAEGRCAGCDGERWISVSEAWVEAQAPWPEPPALGADPATQQAYEDAMTVTERRRVGMANTLYPCKQCNRDVFYRWAKGCHAPDHDPESCMLCQDSRVPARTRGPGTFTPNPNES